MAMFDYTATSKGPRVLLLHAANSIDAHKAWKIGYQLTKYGLVRNWSKTLVKSRLKIYSGSWGWLEGW